MRKYKCTFLVQFVLVDNDQDDDRDDQKTLFKITVLYDNMEN